MSNLNPIVTFNIKDFGTIKVELYPKLAPNTVANFVTYVKDNYYNGLIFHRVIKGFMIQGGWGKPKYPSIKGDFKSNGVENDLLHKAGVISMARTQDPNSATAQFFIMHKDSPHLDGLYAGFGAVVSGQEVVDKIASVRRDPYDKPYDDVVIESATIELNGYILPEVVYVK